MIFVIVFFVAHWYLSLFSQTFFHHRYAAHCAFSMSQNWEKFFFVFAYITLGSSYMSPKAYAIMHRMHHAYTDTDKDPHSPSYDRNPIAMLRRTRKIYLDILENRTSVEPRFTKNLPEWNRFESWANLGLLRLVWVALYTYLYIVLAPSFWFLLLLPLHFVMGPVHGLIINWFAHKYGHVNFKANNTSRNLFKIDWLMMGEGYHNNHHIYPTKSNFAMKKGEFDFCYPVIQLLEKIKVIRYHASK